MPALLLNDVRYRYGDREALAGVSLEVSEGQFVALLGPNGSGKTTLFRVLSTLIPPQQGEVTVFGHDVRAAAGLVRGLLGVVFQAPSLDKLLSVEENLRCHGRLYGLRGTELRQRVEAMLGRVGLADRRRDRVDTLSGGLRRRAELAKGLLHRPRLLLLDEPSTGLDPAARADLWRYFATAREEQGVTIVATTHLLDEADRADRIAILDRGKLAGVGPPDELRASVGGATITLRSRDAAGLTDAINARWPEAATRIDDTVRLERDDAAMWAPVLLNDFGERIDELTIGKPTLEDVFIARTGRRFAGAAAPGA